MDADTLTREILADLMDRLSPEDVAAVTARLRPWLGAAGEMADALTAYFNKRGAGSALRRGNDDICRMADALATWGVLEQKGRR